MKFDPVYVSKVLAENYQDARLIFFEHLIDIHLAHLSMLRQVGLVPAEEAAGRLHTARSRNDIDVTLYRLRWREDLLGLLAVLTALRTSLVELSHRERSSLLPLHTHTQPAQPSTVGHYMMGMVEHLERDSRRLENAFLTMNRCPLGSCAIAGTGLPIDRQLVSRLLGFEQPTGNTYGSIACADYLLETMGALMVMLTQLGRWIQDMLLWSSVEFGFLRLSDGFVQPSSIMPQKRNPVALEHARALASKALAEASAVFQMLHNTPNADIVDIEDDVQPLVHQVFRDSGRVLALLPPLLDEARFDRRRMSARAGQGSITLTELCDTLVRDEGIAFTVAHRIARRMIALQDPPDDLAAAQALAQASLEVVGKSIDYSDRKVREILSPRNFVRVRGHRGGPAPREIARAIRQARKTLASDSQRIQRFSEEIANSLGRLRAVPAKKVIVTR